MDTNRFLLNNRTNLGSFSACFLLFGRILSAYAEHEFMRKKEKTKQPKPKSDPKPGKPSSNPELAKKPGKTKRSRNN
jgi:hypothetical protein